MNESKTQPSSSSTATVDAAQSKQSAELSKLQAEAAKAAAEARSADVTAIKAQREELENATPAAMKRREAIAAKEAAQAEQGAEAARAQQIAALIPDFSKVDRGALDIKGQEPLFGNAMAQRAVDKAAGAVAGKALPIMGDSQWNVLVTNDAELANSDAAYEDVMSAIADLKTWAEAVLPQPTTDGAQPKVLPALVAAAAGAVPGLLSLFSAHRSVMSSSVTTPQIAAAAAVAGALKEKAPTGRVVHDDFRMLPQGEVREKVADVSRLRQRLIAQKAQLVADRSASAASQSKTAETIASTLKRMGESGGDQTELEKQLAAERDALKGYSEALDKAASELGQVESVLSNIESWMAAARTVPPGAKRSPLASAALREQLHGDAANGCFTHVLLVQAQTGGVQQAVDDRPLWFDDKFSVVATATVTYLLLALPDGKLVAAGNAHGIANGQGKIGGELTITVKD